MEMLRLIFQNLPNLVKMYVVTYTFAFHIKPSIFRKLKGTSSYFIPTDYSLL